MSILGDLDGMVLRDTSNPPLTDKGSELTYGEFDGNFVKLYDAVQSIVSGQGVTAYDAGATYDMYSTSIYEKFASYDSRIWKAVYTGSPSSFSGQTPAEGVYWTQITLAELLPNVLELAQFADSIDAGLSASPIYQTDWQSFTAQDLNSNPVDITGLEAKGAGIAIVPCGLAFALDAGASAYDYPAKGIYLVYSTNPAVSTPYMGSVDDAQINSGTDVNGYAIGFTTTTQEIIANDKIQLYSTADATQGTGTYYIKVYYKLITLPF